MKQTGKITSLSGERIIDNSEKKVKNIWQKVIIEEEEGFGFQTSISDRDFILANKSGDLVNKIVEVIRGTKDVICLSSFFIEKSRVTDELILAGKKGVNVYMLTTRDEELMKIDEELTPFLKSIIPKHKELLDELAGKVLVRTAEHFHAKFLLSDPKGDVPKGILMTCNATVDAMGGRNIEIGVTLNRTEVKSLFSQFIVGFWYGSTFELIEKGSLRDVARPEQHKPKLIKPEHLCTLNLKNFEDLKLNTIRDWTIQTIENAKKTIKISSWTFQKEGEVVKALVSKLQEGVKVKVYTRVEVPGKDAYNTEAIYDLARNGAEIIGHERFHAKMLIVDDEVGMISTANFSSLGLEEGFEAGLQLMGEELQGLKEILSYIESICDYRLRLDVKIGELSDGSLVIEKRKNVWTLRENSFEEVIEKDLGKIEVEDVRDLLDYDVKIPKEDDIGSKKTKFIWELVPPTLPIVANQLIEEVEVEVHLSKNEKKKLRREGIKNIPETKKVMEKKPVQGPFPIYSWNDRIIITIKDWKEFDEAVKYAKNQNAVIMVG